MVEATVTKTANLEQVVGKARNAFGARRDTLDGALLGTKIASQHLFSAQKDYEGALRAMNMVDASTSGDAELNAAKAAMYEMIGNLGTGVSDLKEMQSMLSHSESITSESLASLDRFALDSLRRALDQSILRSKGKLSPMRDEQRKFAFTKAPAAKERAPDVLDSMKIDESEEDVSKMSVEAIVDATLGPLHSATAILEVSIDYANQAAFELGEAAELMEQSARLYEEVQGTIEGADEHSGNAKRTLQELVAALKLQFSTANTMKKVSDDVTATVAKVIESIDAFTVNALRTVLYGSAHEPSEDVHFTPPPIDLSGGQGRPATEEHADERQESSLTPLEQCIGSVSDGEFEVAGNFVENHPNQANELIEQLDRLARIGGDEGEALDMVRALKAIAAGKRSESTVKANDKLLALSRDDTLGAVKSEAMTCLIDLGEMES